MNTTQKITLTERHLLIPMIWEGDLELHSNRKRMEQSIFGKPILHGDTVLSLAIQLILEDSKVKGEIFAFSSKYKKSSSVGDELQVFYEKIPINESRERISFEARNHQDDVVLSGSLTIRIRT